MKTEIHPIDVRTLNKGDMISSDTLEDITGHEAGSEKFAFGVLSLRKFIEDGLRKIGKPATLKLSKNALFILTDTEAVYHNSNRQDIAIRHIRKSHRQLTEVDRSKLTDVSRLEHDVAQMRSAFRLLGLKNAKKDLRKALTTKEDDKKLIE